MDKKQLIIIGAGPGGYAAAFLAADLGIVTTLIDSEPNPGGVCLYRGCIPSKALLHVAKVISESAEAKNFGVEFSKPKINIKKMRMWKDDIVNKLTSGLGQISKMRKIEYMKGKASFLDSESTELIKDDGSKETIYFENAIIATGSHPAKIPGLTIESSKVLDSTSALNIDDIPKSMLVIGGGYIGLELGTVYATLGTKITVAEMLPRILTGADTDLVSVLSKKITPLFDSILLETKVVSMEEVKNGIKVMFEDNKKQKSEKVFDKVLISIGRKPNTMNLGLENTKVEINEKGFIKVDNQLRTTDKNIFAIGDVAGEPMLAHKASHEGRTAVEVIAGHKAVFEPKTIPAVVFTDPEIAWCGLTEAEAKEQNKNITVAKFPWAASGRALTIGRTDGLTKLIIDSETERILGVGIVGPGAGDLISEGVLAIEMGANATDIKLSIHPHPTLSETIMESAEVFFGQSTHIYKPRKVHKVHKVHKVRKVQSS
ncbi:MAG: dihydrolipoyl dehydrogenase [Ignavibacteria bacterium]|nr:dihydrolipoyl dehydrogenase [Ignavibacteria bacterium]